MRARPPAHGTAHDLAPRRNLDSFGYSIFRKLSQKNLFHIPIFRKLAPRGRGCAKNPAKRFRERELQRKLDITRRKTEVAEGVWSAKNREMTCSWDGGTCTHGANMGPTWTFSAEDQTDYYVKGFTDPSKCPTHRKEVRGLKSKARRRSRSRSEESRARSRSNSR